jgi:hypothetical protein
LVANEAIVFYCVLLKWSLERGWVGMDWIDMAQDREKWRALVDTVMNLRVS